MPVMRLTRALVLVLAAASAGACTDPLPCGTTQTSAALPGVSIAVSTDTCTFAAGAAGTFTYVTTIKDPLTFTTAPHAGCTPTTSDPASFIVTEVLGTNARYCPTCDVGTCPEDPGEDITIPAGTYMGQLNWPGRQWDGPSDTGKQLGPAFPPGSYTVHVQFTIPAGVIDAKLPITVQ